MRSVDTPQLRGKIIDVLRWADEWVGEGKGVKAVQNAWSPACPPALHVAWEAARRPALS
jgi:hypothetical protein